jgi:hypothetical protein
MSSLGQPPVAEERDSSRLIIAVAVLVVIALALAAAFLLREPPKAPKAVSPYLASLKFSDFKMSAAENFIGHTVSYIDGSITNTGDKTVTHVVVEVVFQDSMGQVAQRDEMPLQVIRTNVEPRVSADPGHRRHGEVASSLGRGPTIGERCPSHPPEPLPSTSFCASSANRPMPPSCFTLRRTSVCLRPIMA